MRKLVRLSVVVIAAAGAAWALVPRNIVIAPRWRVQVVDAAGRPFPRISVVQSWVHFSVKTVPDFEELPTAHDGTVEFAERVVRLRGIDEMAGAARLISKIGIHASFGPDVFIVVSDPGAGGLSVPVTREKAKREGEVLVSIVKLEGLAEGNQ